jgi:hypothetical protein
MPKQCSRGRCTPPQSSSIQLINATSQMRVAGNEKVTSPLLSDGESSCSYEENAVRSIPRDVSMVSRTVCFAITCQKLGQPVCESHLVSELNNAEAICEAVGRANMLFLPVKTTDQQAILALHSCAAGLRATAHGARNTTSRAWLRSLVSRRERA